MYKTSTGYETLPLIGMAMSFTGCPNVARRTPSAERVSGLWRIGLDILSPQRLNFPHWGVGGITTGHSSPFITLWQRAKAAARPVGRGDRGSLYACAVRRAAGPSPCGTLPSVRRTERRFRGIVRMTGGDAPQFRAGFSGL